jgi:hypothetical protein
VTDSEWLACGEPDLMLEAVQGKVTREQLVEFVGRCWERVRPHLPPVSTDVTAADQFAALAPGQSDHDAVLYAAEVALKAARWAPDLKEEQRQQAALLRQIIVRQLIGRVPPLPM